MIKGIQNVFNRKKSECVNAASEVFALSLLIGAGKSIPDSSDAGTTILSGGRRAMANVFCLI
jgi:hypothetical protein